MNKHINKKIELKMWRIKKIVQENYLALRDKYVRFFKK